MLSTHFISLRRERVVVKRNSPAIGARTMPAKTRRSTCATFERRKVRTLINDKGWRCGTVKSEQGRRDVWNFRFRQRSLLLFRCLSFSIYLYLSVYLFPVLFLLQKPFGNLFIGNSGNLLVE